MGIASEVSKDKLKKKTEELKTKVEASEEEKRRWSRSSKLSGPQVWTRMRK